MNTIETNDYTLTYDVSDSAKQEAYEILLAYFKQSENFTGDSIHQSDSTYEDAPKLLTDLAERAFKFKQDWKE